MLLDKNNGVRRFAFDALFLSLALIFSYVEILFPISLLIPLPGFKLGLANMLVLWLLVNASPWDAGIVSFLRILILAALFGTPVSFWFSFGGAFVSFLAMTLTRKMRGVSYIGLSILSAAAHHLGQLVAAACLFGIKAMRAYLPIMLVAAVIFGGLCGMLLNLVAPRIKKEGMA